MKICEIFKSIQGETSYAGLPAVFIRLFGCNLACNYCDTGYAKTEGRNSAMDEVLSEIAPYECNLAVITGGEPLLQAAEVYPLIGNLQKNGYTVLLETNGSLPVNHVPPETVIVMDLKCPGSGESSRMYWDNMQWLKPRDELKFVISSRRDYVWAKQVIQEYQPSCKILMGTVFGRLHPRELAQWILEDKVNARLQLQLHKYIWEPDTRGV